MQETCKTLKAADLEKLEEICARHGADQGAVIPILQDIQEVFGYLPEDAVNFAADRLEMPRSHFYGVATFYAQFHLRPRGRNVVTACTGTTCHVKGSENLISILGRELGIPEGQDTSPDMNYTLEKINCVGACSIAPVIIINNVVHSKMNADKITKEVIKLKGADDGKQRGKD
ncbi:MAG: NAD(P)H-dependent oxidoreductase subunit E [Nitrospiraceae bacterium]|nr:NAD(P)H-dependent oxidoreductase subunit E [Nitrospiraceae bacterium]